MGGVVVVAIYRAGDHHLKRRLASLHRANLYRRCMGSEHSVIGNKKSVLHVARRMIFRKIQRCEIMVIIFDVWSARDFESHAPENVDDLVDNLRNGMGISLYWARSWKRNVYALFGKSLGFGLLFDRFEPPFQRFLEGPPELVQPLALPRPLLGRDISQATQQQRDFTAPTEDFDSDLFQLLLRIGLLDTIQNLSLESFQRITHSSAVFLALSAKVRFCGFGQLVECRQVCRRDFRQDFPVQFDTSLF